MGQSACMCRIHMTSSHLHPGSHVYRSRVPARARKSCGSCGAAIKSTRFLRLAASTSLHHVYQDGGRVPRMSTRRLPFVIPLLLQLSGNLVRVNKSDPVLYYKTARPSASRASMHSKCAGVRRQAAREQEVKDLTQCRSGPAP